ncbi:MAG: molybdopterin molybdotransferase MoeA [Thermoanaerobaculia bacterium]|nr:molybdopterin molybdotransferase MoeA [Thermoanaerobaculia bacterium]
MLAPLAPEEAWNRIAGRLTPLGVERVDRRHALGATLAEALVVRAAIPPCDVSAMDGFALAGDVAPGIELPVAGTVAAGDRPGARLSAGAAMRIWTGAPIPVGADRVVPIEEVAESDGGARVRLHRAPVAGAHVRRRGEVAREGGPLLAAGDRLGPAALALLASQGLGDVAVVRPPRVAVLATGDEVVAPEREPAPGQLRDSHTDYLLAAGRRLGVVVDALGIARDDLDELTATLAGALATHDVVLVCGGVSMGGKDFTEAALARLGGEVVVAGVAIQPGKPLVYARCGERHLFGLPGNPASVMVSFRLFVRPALERLAGRETGFWSEAREVELAAPLAAGKGRDRFVPARARGRGASGRELVAPLGVRGSHDLATFGVADRLLRVPAGAPERGAGALVEAIDWE